MELYYLGGYKEVGKSSFILEESGNRLLLDYGVKLVPHPYGMGQIPVYPDEINVSLDGVVISHAHLDHVGYVPALFKAGKRVKWVSTPPTVDIAEVLWRDALKIARIREEKPPYQHKHIKKAFEYWEPVVYKQKFSFGFCDVSFFNAGHILGSGLVKIEWGDKVVLYTGDFKGSDSYLHSSAEHPGEADIYITEATYWYKNHPSREEAERELVSILKRALDDGRSIILASFAVDRAQQLIYLVRKNFRDVPLYLDGMGKEITKIYLKYPGFLKNYKKFLSYVKTVEFVETVQERRKVFENPSIVITTAGMLDGGPVLWYMLNAPPKTVLVLTGYQAEGTNGRRLLEKKEVVVDGYELSPSLDVYFVDLSAHAGKDEILSYLKNANPEKVYLVHMEEEGYEPFKSEIEEMGFKVYDMKRWSF